jgi:hypothetical protein
MIAAAAKRYSDATLADFYSDRRRTLENDMKMRFLSAAALMLMVTAYGETAYKMGATGDQFRADQKVCDMGSEKDARKACMKTRGWTVMDVDNLRPAPLKRDEAPRARTSKTAAPHTDSAPSSPASTEEASKAADSEASQGEPAATGPVRDPNGKVVVGSWWKFGTTNFKGDAQACTSKLGAAHRYDETNKTTTRAFAQCMRELGWYAY